MKAIKLNLEMLQKCTIEELRKLKELTDAIVANLRMIKLSRGRGRNVSKYVN